MPMRAPRMRQEAGIARDAVRPKHQQVADDLRARIASGDLRPGDPVPSEPDLMESWGYSRETIRKALAALIAEAYHHRAGQHPLRPQIPAHRGQRGRH